MKLIVMLAMLGGPMSAMAADLSDEPAVPEALEPYRIGPGDVIAIDVAGEISLSTKYVVAEDGSIVVPELGKVSVNAKTPHEVVDLLTLKLKDGYLRNPQVTCQVAEYKSQQVNVSGAVGKPGEYFLTGPTTLMEILGRAGDIDTAAFAGEVTITRGDGSVVRASYTDLTAGRGDQYLRAGDKVHVPEAQFVFVSGQVAHPGAIQFTEGLTVTEALTRAGGPAATARLKGAYVLRDGERVPLNLRKILAGRASDVAMQAGDQLFLKESAL